MIARNEPVSLCLTGRALAEPAKACNSGLKATSVEMHRRWARISEKSLSQPLEYSLRAKQRPGVRMSSKDFAEKDAQ